MTDHAPLLERAFSLPIREGEAGIRAAQGEVPRFLRGAYYLNGPALFGRGEVRNRHWLDGDGLVCSVRFEDGRASFNHRFVRTAKFAAEEDAGRSLYRTFGTAFDGDRLRGGIALESPANVSVVPYRGRLLAFGEQGLPWEMDPLTLATRGEFDFGGRLNRISPFSAHPRLDPATGELFNFGISFASIRPHLQVFRFGPDGERIYRKRIPIDAPSSMHDFSVSPSYVIAFLSPYVLDMGVLMGARGTIMDALRWQPEHGSRLLVLARETGEVVADLEAGSRYCLHHINSFEQGDHLVVDLIELDRPVYDQYQVIPDLFTDVPRGRPVRLLLRTGSWTVAERREMAFDKAPDFPAIDPRRKQRPYEDLWALAISQTGVPGRKFFDQLVHLSWERPRAADAYQAPAGCYMGGEPSFLPDPARDGEGVVMCQQFDARRGTSAFVLFDPRAVARGPLCTLELERPVPPLFHSWFEAAAA